MAHVLKGKLWRTHTTIEREVSSKRCWSPLWLGKNRYFQCFSDLLYLQLSATSVHQNGPKCMNEKRKMTREWKKENLLWWNGIEIPRATSKKCNGIIRVVYRYCSPVELNWVFLPLEKQCNGEKCKRGTSLSHEVFLISQDAPVQLFRQNDIF